MAMPPWNGHESDGTLPPASLIIPSRNRPHILVETIASVLEGEDVPAELIIIDQSDTRNEALANLVHDRACSVRYEWARGQNVSKARNAGIRAAAHDLLVFVDDDVRVTAGWYRAMLQALLDAGNDVAITGRVLPERSGAAGGFVPSTIDNQDAAVYHGRIASDVLYSNNMAFHRSIVDAIGGFDERLGGGAPYRSAEDNEFAFRLLEAGFRIHYRPEPVLYHRAWREKRDYLPLSWGYGYGQGGYYAKHLSLRDRHMLWRFRRDIGHRLMRMLRLATKSPHRSVGQLVYVAGLVSGWGHWLITQRLAARGERSTETRRHRD
jgi:glycosyltransferase involved in cell wall biosynthesis